MTFTDHGRTDILVTGAGIVGLATAWALARRLPRLSIIVIDKEPVLAAHQTGHNSGVVHSGIYYRPGSAKATLAVKGHDSMIRFCTEHGITYDQRGKLIVAVAPDELDRLANLQSRAKANGVPCTRVDGRQLAEMEPNVNGLAALYVPGTAIVDYREVCQKLVALLSEHGIPVHLGVACTGWATTSQEVRVRTSGGEILASALVNCAGLWADKAARLANTGRRQIAIVPFRGGYYSVAPDKANIVNKLIYPVPDLVYPFLGVHLTPDVRGGLHAGPSAVLALSRAGYTWRSVSLRDTIELATFPGIWRLAMQHWPDGARELYRSLSRHAFGEAVRRLVPAIDDRDLLPAPAGVRAQALSRRGDLLDDFLILENERVVNVINAPSPAATASLEIGEIMATKVSALLM